MLKQIDVMEISLVTFPANDKARITSVKSAQDFSERDFERLLRDAGFAKKAAQTIIEHGYQHFARQTDSLDQHELKAIAARLAHNINIFQI